MSPEKLQKKNTTYTLSMTFENACQNCRDFRCKKCRESDLIVTKRAENLNEILKNLQFRTLQDAAYLLGTSDNIRSEVSYLPNQVRFNVAEYVIETPSVGVE